MKILLNGATYTSKTVYESDNYGSIRQTWPAGTYTVLIKAGWHTDDVKDLGFRIYGPVNVTIISSNMSDADGTAALIKGDL